MIRRFTNSCQNGNLLLVANDIRIFAEKNRVSFLNISPSKKFVKDTLDTHSLRFGAPAPIILSWFIYRALLVDSLSLMQISDFSMHPISCWKSIALAGSHDNTTDVTFFLDSNLCTCERTDAIVIVLSNPHFRRILTERNTTYPKKVVTIPASTKLVGTACDERFCYVMTFDRAISCVQGLPMNAKAS
ncbi:unnamed protein product [Cylicocyclus nassatus]|uniref:Uncharacterized protein n=1 Tax=Cylicocyclus nassatus TaxID=53992 RepID=A0AA36GP61_CYLNA|nr:unnamed protein product [Cylicocyclus nassatus]